MINTTRNFLPIKSIYIYSKRNCRNQISRRDKGKFVSNSLVTKQDYSIHVLNYNSPSATGALPIPDIVVDQLLEIKSYRLSIKKKIN